MNKGNTFILQNVEAVIPREKLRGAALSDATLTAQKRPLAQPAEEGKKVLTLTISFAKKPVLLTEVLQVSMDDAEDVSNRQRIHAIGNHHYCSRRVQRVPSSRNPCPCRKSSKPNGGRLDRFIGMTIWGVMFEGVRDLTTYREVWASISQIQLEVCLGRLPYLLTFSPNRTLGLISAVPDPFTNVERREGAVDCKITRRGKAIHRSGDVAALQLTYLPVQLQQHVVDTSHLKRVHRSAPFLPVLSVAPQLTDVGLALINTHRQSAQCRTTAACGEEKYEFSTLGNDQPRLRTHWLQRRRYTPQSEKRHLGPRPHLA